MNLICVKCDETLRELECSKCSITYKQENGIPIIISEEGEKERIKRLEELKNKYEKNILELTLEDVRHVLSGRKHLTESWNKEIKRIKRKIRGDILILGAFGLDERSVLKNRKLTIVDINNHSLWINKKFYANYKDSYICADFHKLPFPENSFDTILSSSILQHADKNGVFGKEMSRVLKGGGTYYAINETFFEDILKHVYKRIYFFRKEDERRTVRDYKRTFSEENGFGKAKITLLKKPSREMANKKTKLYYSMIQFLPDKIIEKLSSRVRIEAGK